MSATTPEAGVLLVDKPAGVTSHDVVVQARRALGVRKLGHTGTLDPFATGLLLLCVGKVTRLSELFHLLDKSYEAMIRFGIETDTHDATGAITREFRRQLPDSAQVERALRGLIGARRQRPPAYSAKKVAGRRAHRIARAGARLELEPVTIRIHEAQLLGYEPPSARASFRVSTGTYLRAIARDLGRDLVCGAHLSALRRTAIGPFSVESAVAPALLGDLGVRRRGWRTPAQALDWLPSRELGAEEVRRVQEGRRVSASTVRLGMPLPTRDGEESGWPVALLHRGDLVAVAEPLGSELQPRKVLVDR